MILFYSSEINNNIAVFNEEEARHCVQVLRKKQGDVVRFTDGKGHWYDGVILEIGKKQFTARIDQQWKEEYPAPPIHLAVAPTKNMDRFEWFLEKATELGIREITPLLCEHSERRKLRADRLEKILLTAMKQSMRASLPVLHSFTEFKSFIQFPDRGEQRFIAHCHSNSLPHLINSINPGKPVLILIGPEGDFSEAEVTDAVTRDFLEIGLGNSRLRTETAAIAACHIANLSLGKSD